MRVFLRSLMVSVPRLFVVVAFGYGLSQFEVSPLPEWTLSAFAYIAHFFLTMLFTWWVLHRVLSPTTRDAWVISSVFVILGTVWELSLYIFILRVILQRTFTWSLLFSSFTWESLALVGTYVVAIHLATYWKRQHTSTQQMPEGIQR